MDNPKDQNRPLIETRTRSMFIIFGLVSLAVAGAIALPLISEGESSSDVATVDVSRGTIMETVDAMGVVTAMPSAALSWQSSGIVSDYDLRVGDVVEKGQVLLTLEDSSISPDILQARTSLLEAQSEYQKMLSTNKDYLTALQEVNTQEVILENTYSMRHEFYDDNTEDERVEGIYASYTQARVDVWVLEDAYEKVKDRAADDTTRTNAYDALQAGILKRDSLQRAMSQIMGTPYGQRTEDYFILYDVRAAELAQARAQAQRLLDASDELSAAQAEMQALQNMVDQASIIAPFEGTVTNIQSPVGGYAGSGDFAIQLDDLSNLVIEVEISQMEINKIMAGQTALVTFSALPNASYEGVVDEISQAGSTNGDDALFKVRIVLTDEDEQVKPGFTAMASIITNQVESALLIPNQAIQYAEDGGAFVLKTSGLDQSTEIRVETGARSDAYSELVGGGLEEGDTLLIAAAGSESYQAGSGEALRDARRLFSGR